MQEYESFTREELVEKFKPIKVTFQPWPYKESLIQSIKKRETTQIGSIKYVVQFKDGQIAKISAKSLNETNKELVEEFEINQFRQSEPVNRKRTFHYQTKNSFKKKIKLQTPSEDIVYSSDEDEYETSATITRSGRKLTQSKSFQREFYPPGVIKSKTTGSAYSYRVPVYEDATFISKHSISCFKCLSTGSHIGPLDVPVGPDVKRIRMFLCKTCSYSCHNNCLPSATASSFDKETGEYICAKCIQKKCCVECDKSKSKETNPITFRCNLCARGFHEKCVKKGVSPALTSVMEKTDVDNMYKSGLCLECVTFGQAHGSIAAERVTNNKAEFLIKWKDVSYRHTNWVIESWYQAAQATAYRSYINKRSKENFEVVSTIPIEWQTVDRILNVEWIDKKTKKVRRIFAVFKDSSYDEAVWDNPPTEEETELYSDYKLALDRFIQASSVKPPVGMKKLIGDVRKVAKTEKYEKHELKVQPDYINGGTLMNHQLEALNWLLYQWENQQSCILADDMGLGKTIQIIAYLYTLFKRYKIYPFVIVVPNSTATNWIREFHKWAPEMAVAPFFGSAAARNLALDNEIFDAHMNLKCHVVVATYESSLDATKLQKLFWAVMVVDESQRLKNDNSLLFQKLKTYAVDQITLLTGTPLQNNLRELFNIMNFIQPKKFHGNEAQNYIKMSTTNVEDLHSRLRPHFLRRTKGEVLKALPPKYELIVPLSMTTLQKEVYKECLSGEIHETLNNATDAKRQRGLSNIFMNLRKTLNHPYLLDGVERPQPTLEETQSVMINAGGKLKLFHQMYPKLRAQGHRMLIFSTMTRTLDILEDYFAFEKIGYVRIDGSNKERDRVRSIDAFNAPDSNVDVFLLSTRAGGVGINLATADTIIIWDSDYNPYADLQAISRAHRIGQKRMVLILRLMTRGSIEEKVLQIGKSKMALEHVVVERMKENEEETYDDYESILKFGAEALFSDDTSKDIHYDPADIDSLLDREKYREAALEKQQEEIKAAKEGEERAIEQGLNFSFAKVWKADGSVEDIPPEDDIAKDKDGEDFWKKFLKEKEIEAARKKEEKRLAIENLGRGARKRAVVSYNEKTKDSHAGAADETDETFRFEEAAAVESEDDEEVEDSTVIDKGELTIIPSTAPDQMKQVAPRKIKGQKTIKLTNLSVPLQIAPQTQQMSVFLPEDYKGQVYNEMLRVAAPHLQRMKNFAAKVFSDNLHNTPEYKSTLKKLYEELFTHLDQHFRQQFLAQYTKGQGENVPREKLDRIYELQLHLLHEHFNNITVIIHNEMTTHTANLNQMREHTMNDVHHKFLKEQEEKKKHEERLEQQRLAEESLKATEALKRVQQQEVYMMNQRAVLKAQMEANQAAQKTREKRLREAYLRGQEEIRLREQRAAETQTQQAPAQIQAPFVQAQDVIPQSAISQMRDYIDQVASQGISKDFIEQLNKLASRAAAEEQAKAEQEQAAATEEKHRQEQAAAEERYRQEQAAAAAAEVRRRAQQNQIQSQPQNYNHLNNNGYIQPQFQQYTYNDNTQQYQQQQPMNFVDPSQISRNNAAYFSNVSAEVRSSLFNLPPPPPNKAAINMFEKASSNSSTPPPPQDQQHF